MSHKLQDAQTKIKELETTVEKEKSWGTKTWDNTSSWGTQNTTIEEEKHGKEQTHHNQKTYLLWHSAISCNGSYICIYVYSYFRVVLSFP